MGCGVAPRGSIRLAHLAAKLSPSICGGPHMPVSPPTPTYLLFSDSFVCIWVSVCAQQYLCELCTACSMFLKSSKT